MMHIVRRVAAAGLVVVAAGASAAPARSRSTYRECLRSHIGLSESDLSRLRRGGIVARSVSAQDSHEIGVVGIVRVSVPAEFVVSRFRDITTYKKSDMVLQVGPFSDPPSLADVDRLTLEEGDINAIRSCRPGDCGVKLSRETMARFAREVDWKQPDYRERANALERRIVVEQLQAYISAGPAALGAYADKKDTVSLDAEFRALVARPPEICQYMPELFAYLREYPRSTLNGVDSFFYWSKEAFGLKPVISVTHVVIYHARPGLTFIASKSLYSTHYMTASLGLTILGSDETGDSAVDIMYVNRSRSDSLDGPFAGLKRAIVGRRQREAVEKNMRIMKARLELWRAQ